MFQPQDLFVSPLGRDSWSGRRPEPTEDHTDGPLASLAGARDRIRQLKDGVVGNHETTAAAGFVGPMTVWMRDGRYEITDPVVFGPQDSAPVTYAAYPNENPVIDGGQRITGWQEETVHGVTAWVAELPDVAEGTWNFRQLFVNGRRAVRPRLPKQGLYRMEEVPGLELPAGWGGGGHTQFRAKPGDARAFENLQDVEVVYVHFWIGERSPIASYDEDTQVVTMVRPSRAALVGSHGRQLADYYFDNVFEGLTKPGEWYLHRKAGRLYYLPLPGETMDNTEIYAPRTLQLMALVGDADRQEFVEFLQFRGILFQHTDWRHPDPSDEQAEFIAGAQRTRGNAAAAGQGDSDVPGVVFMEAARHCAVENCTLRHIGWYGVELSDACSGVRIVGNTIHDMGAGGVKINGASAKEPVHRRTGNHWITDNTIYSGGRVFHSAIGVLSMHANQVRILHNHIYDLFYSGISVGWVWGYAESVSRDNLVENNHIHDLGQGLLSDMGGIYTLGPQPGTVLRQNLIHDVTKAHYGAWCIYPDEGSSHLLIENNICYDTNGEAFHQHYGRENVVRNNIFAFGGDAQMKLSRVDPLHKGYTALRNIIVTDGKPVFSYGYNGRFSNQNIVSDLNLYFDISGDPVMFTSQNQQQSIDLVQWQAYGEDTHSVAADPRFADLENRDFTLADDSPAWDLGFKPIDLSAVGPRTEQDRR